MCLPSPSLDFSEGTPVVKNLTTELLPESGSPKNRTCKIGVGAVTPVSLLRHDKDPPMFASFTIFPRSLYLFLLFLWHRMVLPLRMVYNRLRWRSALFL
uniref:Uncharacterized protein n=1 Tax=Babesia bovis TaxID=5865 RepID=S6B6F7_BABBO|nr:hypothetical protein [Babesia bovis]